MSISRAVDYYRVLQVDPDAEPEVVAAAYRKLAAKYHPDVNRSDEAPERMREINAAYEVLGDPAQRAAYDRARGARAAPWAPADPAAPPPSRDAVMQGMLRSIVTMVLWSVAVTYVGRLLGGTGGMTVALLIVLALVLWKGSAIMKYLGRSR